MRWGVVVLAMALVGLLVALFAMKQASDDRAKKDTEAVLDFSNRLVTARADLDELNEMNLRLTNDLTASRQETLAFRALLQNARDQIAGLNRRVDGLALQNQVLNRRAAALSSAIDSLNFQIAGTQQQLADSQTNNSFLERELRHQMAVRTELENKFNNLAVVRAQVNKLKSDEFAARRLQWMSEGTDPLSQPKGAQQLMQGPASALPRPNYDLNVEVSSDGSIRILPSSNNIP